MDTLHCNGQILNEESLTKSLKHHKKKINTKIIVIFIGNMINNVSLKSKYPNNLFTKAINNDLVLLNGFGNLNF